MFSLAWLFVMCSSAGAQDSADGTFGQVLCNALNNAAPFSEVFSWVSWIAGISATLRGVWHLKAHAENPGQNRLNVPLMYLLGGMFLLALPNFVGMVITSLFGSGGSPTGGLADLCTPLPVKGGQSLDLAMTAFIDNIKQPMTLVISITAMLAGLWMVVSGLMKVSKAPTDPKSYSPQIILANVGFGAMLIMIGESLNTMMASFFGTSTITQPATLNWAMPGNTSTQQFTNAMAGALTFVQIVGGIAFVRGWLILKKIVEGTSNEPMAKALTHIIGGVLCVNIGGWLEILDATFGTNFIG